MIRPALLLLTALTAAAQRHDDWDAILKQYVTADARVDYAGIGQTAKPKLDQYIATLAPKWAANQTPAARKAALINAYNALTVSWILTHYPVESIWRTKKPFTAKRHTVDGRLVSLDEIETELRNMGDPRVHAVLVCASRGCPPLRREAYTESPLESQIDDNTRVWLSRPIYHEYNPQQNRATISKIFDWYHGDFEKNGGSVWAFLARYNNGFPNARTSLKYKSYHWGLNDTSAHGEKYSQVNFLWDAARNK
jgi:hypothetical protein